MITRRLVFGVLCACTLTGRAASAQGYERTVTSALEDLDDGYVDRYGLFNFQGCPQSDDLGRTVFNAVRQVQLPGYGMISLMRALMWDTYPDCDYAPLNEWVAQAFEDLRARGDAGPAQSFARGLGPLIDDDLQEALLRAAEDTAFAPGGTRRVFADAALRFRPEERQIAEAIAAFQRNIPAQSKVERTYYLSRHFGAAFFQAMAQAAPRFSDRDLFRVVSAIGVDVSDGRVSPDAAGLDELRAQVSSRPSAPSWAQIPVTAR